MGHKFHIFIQGLVNSTSHYGQVLIQTQRSFSQMIILNKFHKYLELNLHLKSLDKEGSSIKGLSVEKTSTERTLKFPPQLFSINIKKIAKCLSVLVVDTSD